MLYCRHSKEKELTMILVIDTQYMENYGAHDWDGKGECPQYWKAKGGNEYKVTGIPKNVDVDHVLFMLGQEVQWSDNGSISTVIGTHIEGDDYLSWFEKSQLEYDGSISFKEPSISYTELCRLEAAKETTPDSRELTGMIDYYGA
jgi:hypothetical protein